MRRTKFTLVAAVAMTIIAQPVLAESCYDLWYERNQIYDENGFCFSTDLGASTFDNGDCYTDSPSLSRSEQRRVNQIKREERARGCKVNN